MKFTVYAMKWVLGIGMLFVLFYSPCHSQNSEDLISDEWNVAFEDNCTDDWTTNWILDGKRATIENTPYGMHFEAGPEAGDDAHHAVLWTKEAFTGDIKIEYDYTRTDAANKYVTLLYIQATGDEEAAFAKDIMEWNNLREVPAMKTYFENMKLLHISYAAFGNKGDGFYYVRARQYPKPKNKPFAVTQIQPSYDYKGFFKTNQKYHVTAIKSGKMLYFKIESMDGEELFSWDLSDLTPITAGRIGLRHMYTRSAIYKNFKVYTKN